MKYLVIRKYIKENKVVIKHVSTELIVANHLTKDMLPKSFKDYVKRMRVDPVL